MEELPNEIIERVIVCLDLGELLPLRVSQSLAELVAHDARWLPVVAPPALRGREPLTLAAHARELIRLYARYQSWLRELEAAWYDDEEEEPDADVVGRATALASSSSSSNAKGGIGGSGSRCTTASVAASGGSGNAPPSSAGASTAKSSCGRQEDDPKWKHRTPEQQHEAQGRSSFASTKRGVVPGLNDGDEIAAG